MKSFLRILFLLQCFFQLSAQEITFKPIFIDQCSGKPSVLKAWFIIGSDSLVEPIANNRREVILSEKESYTLYDDFGQAYPFSVDKLGTTRDTFNLVYLSFHTEISNPPSSYFMACGSLATGRLTDYFYNGNTRMTGLFKEGQPIDTLKSYYRSGQPKEVYIPLPTGDKHFFYFDNGGLELERDNQKKIEKSYYETGELKQKVTWGNRNRYKTKVFDKDGSLISKNKLDMRLTKKWKKDGTPKN